jgi:hypothetical protein
MTAFSRLRDFLDRQMRMSHIYQPVMLEVLLASGGTRAGGIFRIRKN